ncbi:MAG TPA: flippase [Rhodothermales bacterium]|nr:flippase [Rhodothermales bacterium]
MNDEIKRAGFFQNLTALTLGNVLVRPIWVFFSIYMSAEYLGKEGFGVFNFAISLMTVVAELADLGITHYANRELVRRPDFGSVLLTNVLVVKGGATLLIVLAAWTGAWLGHQSATLQWALVWAGLYTAVFRHLEFLRAFFRANQVLKYESISMIVEKSLVVLGGVGFLLVFFSPEAALFGMSLGMVTTFLLVLYGLHRYMAAVNMRLLNLSLAQTMYRSALPMGLMGLFIMAYRYMGVLVLYALYGEATVGVYSLPLRIIETLQLIPTILGATIFAYFTQSLHENRLVDFKRMLQKSLLSMLGVGFAAVVAVWLGGYQFIKLFKPEFAAAEGLIKLLIWSFPVTCLNSILVLALMALDEQRFMAKAVGGAMLAALGLNFWLVSQFEVYGAIAAFLAMDALLCMALLSQALHKIQVLAKEKRVARQLD